MRDWQKSVGIKFSTLFLFFRQIMTIQAALINNLSINTYKTILLGIDPGQTTGVAILGINSRTSFDVISLAQVPYENRFEFFSKVFQQYPDMQIVMEDFKIYPYVEQTGSPVWSARIIGLVELLHYQHKNPRPIVFHMAHEIHDNRAKKLTGSKVTIPIEPEHAEQLKKLRHATDAYAHGKLWILRNFPK